MKKLKAAAPTMAPGPKFEIVNIQKKIPLFHCSFSYTPISITIGYIEKVTWKQEGTNNLLMPLHCLGSVNTFLHIVISIQILVTR
jgi:hypothetical protein